MPAPVLACPGMRWAGAAAASTGTKGEDVVRACSQSENLGFHRETDRQGWPESIRMAERCARGKRAGSVANVLSGEFLKPALIIAASFSVVMFVCAICV